MSSNLLQQAYSLTPGESLVTVTLITGGYINTEGTKSISFGQVGTNSPASSFTVYSDYEYALAMVETQYDPVSLPAGTVDPPSYCHVYFKLGSTDWYWSTDALPADNPTIFDHQGEHTSADIVIQLPTELNPSGIVSTFPCLNSDLVFLLDMSAAGNMLFRGNEPLKPGTSGQDIDFEMLHRSMATKYMLQTGKSDFPEIGKYLLRDIAFLNPTGDEGDMLGAEIASFGAQELSEVSQKWFPLTPAAVPNGQMIGQVANWNVEPEADSVSLNLELVSCLKEWMQEPMKDNSGNALPVIYYIHCSSGHDRTGMMASAYLAENYGLDVSEGYILGTTIHKLGQNYGGNLIQDCSDVASGNIDPDRSRCFVAGNGIDSTYNDTVLAMYKQATGNAVAFSTNALSGDPAIGATGTVYVRSYYPWEKYIYNPSAITSGEEAVSN